MMMVFHEPKIEYVEIKRNDVISTSSDQYDGPGGSYCERHGSTKAMEKTAFCDLMKISGMDYESVINS